MIVSNKDFVEGISMSGGAKNVIKKTLISPEEGWKDYVMRHFELGEGGYAPKHTHPWPHISYILSGEGTIEIDGKINKVKEGSFAYVPENTEHQFLNTGSGKFSFICIVPPEGN